MENFDAQNPIGKPITRAEARRLALNTLETAEKERLASAERECDCGRLTEREELSEILSRIGCVHEAKTGEDAEYIYRFGLPDDVNPNMPKPTTVIGAGQSYFFFDERGKFQGYLTDDTCDWIARRENHENSTNPH